MKKLALNLYNKEVSRKIIGVHCKNGADFVLYDKPFSSIIMRPNLVAESGYLGCLNKGIMFNEDLPRLSYNGVLPVDGWFLAWNLTNKDLHLKALEDKSPHFASRS